MASLINATDWASTGVGPRETWPHSLTTTLRILIASRYQMWMAWGKDLTFFCNDAYTPILGVKHPWAPGKPANQVWSEIWTDIGPRIELVIRTGRATWDEGLLLFLERNGFSEETYHTFSYSPLPDDDGTVAGMLCVVMEETQRVIGERRVATLRDLASELGVVRSEPEALDAVVRSLGRNSMDLPFSLIYLADGQTGRLWRTTDTAIIDGATAPETVSRLEDLPFPVAAVLSGAEKRVVHDVTGLAGLPVGAWDQPSCGAAIVPIAQQGQDQPAGVFIAGLNPYRPFDESYSGFIDLVAAQIAPGLGVARAYEAERQRAEALAEIDRAKTAFFSNVSHEFRTPLTLMLGPLEDEIAALGRNVPAAEHLAMAHRNGLRLLRLVNALLDFSRIEAERVQARDAMPEGGRLTIETANTHLDEAYVAEHDDVAAGQYVMIAVSDTGTGMSRETLGRVFEPFFTTKDIGHGTGLGLSQVYGFIKQSDGHVNLYSEMGQGTAVKLYLPRLIAPRPETATDADDDLIPLGHGETILVVEDEPAVREHSINSLRDLGYRVVAAEDGHAALRTLAREAEIDVLFTDVGLPGGMTGRQLVEAARARWPGLKVVYTTGYARNAIVHGGILEPGPELLPKPFSYAPLATKIRTVINS
ncbi:response regulator [Acidisphaera sp. S103]|uniref:response regulator n=1 Tax=Acidisphaera sp. S103 TaxID=1747223 RepID=UPI00131E222D|nr:response regulator [Acidisphaera sp. S103]